MASAHLMDGPNAAATAAETIAHQLDLEGSNAQVAALTCCTSSGPCPVVRGPSVQYLAQGRAGGKLEYQAIGPALALPDPQSVSAATAVWITFLQKYVVVAEEDDLAPVSIEVVPRLKAAQD